MVNPSRCGGSAAEPLQGCAFKHAVSLGSALAAPIPVHRHPVVYVRGLQEGVLEVVGKQRARAVRSQQQQRTGVLGAEREGCGIEVGEVHQVGGMGQRNPLRSGVQGRQKTTASSLTSCGGQHHELPGARARGTCQ